MRQARVQGTEAVVAGLLKILPPDALVHVGVGQGTGAMHRWRELDVPAAWLVDADAVQMAWAERLAAGNPGWHACTATVAELDGEAPFFVASNPGESGLVAIEKLNALWPNLRAGEQSPRPTVRLDTLLADAGEASDGECRWLIVDCLPALRILRGATATLERCSVLWLRTLLQALPDSEPGTTFDELQDFLAPLGFRCIELTEGNHPAVGEAIFVRDWARRLQPLIGELRVASDQIRHQNADLAQRLAAQEAANRTMQDAGEAQARSQAELAERFAALEATHGAATGALAKAESALSACKSERDALAKEKDGLLAERDARNAGHAELAGKLAGIEKAHAASTAALETAEAGLATCKNERDAQAKVAAERQDKLDALAKEKAGLLAELDARNAGHAELAGKLAEIEKAHAASAAALETAEAGLAACRNERAALDKEKAAQLAAIAARDQEKATLGEQLDAAIAARQALAEHGESLQGQLEQATKTRDEQTRLAGERGAQLADLGKEVQTLKAALEDKDAALARLNEKVGEQDQRERQLVEEIVRAEAQIDLIKDLLLREGGL